MLVLWKDSGTSRRDHISPVLASLNSLLLRFRICSKLLLLVYKGPNGLTMSYITDLLIPSSAPPLSQVGEPGLLDIPRSIYKIRRDPAFADSAPKLCNSIPLPVRSAPYTDPFKSRLKTLIFSFDLTFFGPWLYVLLH